MTWVSPRVGGGDLNFKKSMLRYINSGIIRFLRFEIECDLVSFIMHKSNNDLDWKFIDYKTSDNYSKKIVEKRKNKNYMIYAL